MLIPHGWPKLLMGVGATANMALVKRGIARAEPLSIALRGGGPYSLDRKVGREL